MRVKDVELQLGLSLMRVPKLNSLVSKSANLYGFKRLVMLSPREVNVYQTNQSEVFSNKLEEITWKVLDQEDLPGYLYIISKYKSHVREGILCIKSHTSRYSFKYLPRSVSILVSYANPPRIVSFTTNKLIVSRQGNHGVFMVTFY